MKSNSLFKVRPVLMMICLPVISALMACSRGPVPVSIHGVNYSEEPFSYVLEDPANKENTGGGELVDSYAAGGTMCCYELPSKWHPGLKVKVTARFWVGELANNTLNELPLSAMADVASYPSGKPGEIWVIRRSNGIMELVISDVQPDHPNWPGAIKGWPVPSVEFQRKVWDIYIKNEQGAIRAFEALQIELKSAPDEAARKEWERAAEYRRESLAGFTGPNDPRYRAKLAVNTEEMLEICRAELTRLQKGRP